LLFDELIAAGRPISLEDFNLYVFCGLRGEFKDLVTNLVTKAELLSYADLNNHLLTHEFLHKTTLQSMDGSLPLLSQPPLLTMPLLILPHLIITPILVVIGVVLMATGVPTATVTIIRTCLAISYIGHTTLHSSKRIFKLSNVLHVPHITKPLLYVQKFYRDDNVYFEFHASVFYFKDFITKEVLLLYQSNDGLYVLSESSATSILKPIGLLASPQLLICGIVN
jgi:hypothetical protein